MRTEEVASHPGSLRAHSILSEVKPQTLIQPRTQYNYILAGKKWILLSSHKFWELTGGKGDCLFQRTREHKWRCCCSVCGTQKCKARRWVWERQRWFWPFMLTLVPSLQARYPHVLFFPIQSCSWEKIPRPGNTQLVCNSGVVQQVSTHQTCSVLGIYWGKDYKDFLWICKYLKNLVLISKNPAINNVTNKKRSKFSDVDSSMKLPLSGQHCLLFMAIAFCICLFLSPYMFYAINCLQVSLLRAGTALYSLLVYFTWVIFLFFFFSCAHFIRRAYLCVCLVTQSYLTLGDPMDCSPPGSSVRGDSPGKNTGVGCHALLQGIFPSSIKEKGI